MPFNLSSMVLWVTLFLAGYGLGRHRASKASPQYSRTSSPSNPSNSDPAIEAQIRAGRKIEAIKLDRQRDGSGLKETRQAVEAMSARIIGNQTH